MSGEPIVAPDNYPSKGTGELGTFFYDSEGDLIGVAQPVREGREAGVAPELRRVVDAHTSFRAATRTSPD